MRFISVRDLRNRPGEVWKRLREEELVLTANGRPRGILLSLDDEDDIEQTLMTLRRARAQTAVSRMRARAAETGADRLSPEEIEREVEQSRRERTRG